MAWSLGLRDCFGVNVLEIGKSMARSTRNSYMQWRLAQGLRAWNGVPGTGCVLRLARLVGVSSLLWRRLNGLRELVGVTTLDYVHRVAFLPGVSSEVWRHHLGFRMKLASWSLPHSWTLRNPDFLS